MTTVNRYAIPPKRMAHKCLHTFGEWEFNEDALLAWFREHGTGHIQYDYTKFQGSYKFSPKTVQLTVWFQHKADAESFKLVWIK